MKTKIVNIERNPAVLGVEKVGLLPDATHYISCPILGVGIYKIESGKVYIQDPKEPWKQPDPDKDPHDQYQWELSTVFNGDYLSSLQPLTTLTEQPTNN